MLDVHLSRMQTVAEDLGDAAGILSRAIERLHREIDDAHATLAGQQQLPGIPGEPAESPVIQARGDILARLEDAEGALERGEGQLVLRCLREIRSLVEGA